MFKWYGIFGIILIILVELNFFLKLEPFASWYFPIIWLGYILVLDALVYKLKKHSLISNKPYTIAGMTLISSLFWFIFELINLSIQNWSYQGLDGLTTQGANLTDLFGLLSFATVLPAFFETVELIRTIHLFDNKTLKKRHTISKTFLHGIIVLGVFCCRL